MTSMLFRVDAGPVVGLGHLQRCVSLASALRARHVPSVFLTNDEPAVRERVARDGFDAVSLNRGASWSPADLERTIAVAESRRCHTVVVDSDEEGEEFLRRLREAGFIVCAIEDLAPHPFPCQLVVNGDAHARALPYTSSSGDTVFLLGPDYAMVREELWSVPQRAVRETPQRLLVMLGGDDPHHLMPEIVRLIGTLPGPLHVTAVIGPFFSRVEAIEAAAAQSCHPVELIRAPSRVLDLMLEADVAVSAGGQTLYELARVGCPTVAVRTAANQDGQMQVLAQLGVIRAAGGAEEPMVAEAIGAALRSVWHDVEARSAMRAAASSVVDGQGALRVASALLEVSGQLAPQEVRT